MLLKIVVKFLRLLPHRTALALGRFLGLVLRLFLWKKVDRAEARCVASLGVGVTTARGIVRGSFMNLGMSVVEFVRFPVMKTRVAEYIDSPEGTDASKAVRAYPTNLMYSGIRFGSSAVQRGTYGGNWSSTVYDYEYVYIGNFNKSIVYPGTSYSGCRYYGFTVRCLAD